MALHIPWFEAQASLELCRAACQCMDGRPVNVAPVLQVDNSASACIAVLKLSSDLAAVSERVQITHELVSGAEELFALHKAATYKLLNT